MQNITIKIPNFYLTNDANDPVNIILDWLGATKNNEENTFTITCASSQYQNIEVLDFKDLNPNVIGAFIQAYSLAKSNVYFESLTKFISAIDQPVSISIFDVIRLIMATESDLNGYEKIELAVIDFTDGNFENILLYSIAHPGKDFELLNDLSKGSKFLRAQNV